MRTIHISAQIARSWRYIVLGFLITTALLAVNTILPGQIMISNIVTDGEAPEDLLPSLVFPQRADLRAEISKRVTPDGSIIIPAVIDGGYAETALNFYLGSISQLGLEDNTLFLCVDKAACLESQASGVPALMYKQSVTGISDVFDSKAFIEKAMTKHFIIYEILLLGYSVLLTDLDMHWFKSPLDNVKSVCNRCDFAIQNEADEGLNIGFVYVRPTRMSIAFYETILRTALDGDTRGAQKLFNDLVQEYKNDLNYKVLNVHNYPDGQTYFEKHKRIFYGENPCWYCYIVHNNWIVGTRAKRYRFREHLMWKVDTDEYYSSATRRYIRYENAVPETGLVDEHERHALYTALAVAKVLGRTLILPKVFNTANGKKFNLNGVAIIKHFDTEFDGQYRESSFLSHPLVPATVTDKVCGKILIKSTFYADYPEVAENKDIKWVFTPEDAQKGATEAELTDWFSQPEFDDCAVLDFHSLYRSFAGFTNSNENIEFKEKFFKAHQPGAYRQKALLY